MSHRNAPLTATGRAWMVALVIEHQWPQRRVAERFGVAPATVNRWANRHRAGEGPGPRVVDTLTPAMSWGRKVVFHHAPEDLLFSSSSVTPSPYTSPPTARH